MDFLDITQHWYDRNGDEINPDTALFYLVELFQELKCAGFTKEDLPEVGERLLYLLDIDVEDKGVHMLHQRMLAEEINSAFRIVNKKVKEFKEEEQEEIKQVVTVEDGDIYPNNTSEPDIDLRGADLGTTTFDEEFIRKLGIKNE